MQSEPFFNSQATLGPPFEVDILAPSQHLRKFTSLEPEKNLMLAVLEDALVCYQKYLRGKTKAEKTLFKEAEEWIWDEGGNAIFSFQNISETLELDPQRLRSDLLLWKMKTLETHFQKKVRSLPLTPEGSRQNLPQRGSGNSLKIALGERVG